MAILDNEDTRTLVKQHVKATGMLKDAWIVAGYSTESGFFAYLKEHPDFHDELNRIKRFSDPTITINLIEKALNAVEQNLTQGAFKKILDVNPATGKPELKKVIETGASKWAVELVLSQPNFTEASINMIVASQIHSITHNDKWTDEQRKILYEFLLDFRKQELIELMQKGIPVKDDSV